MIESQQAQHDILERAIRLIEAYEYRHDADPQWEIVQLLKDLQREVERGYGA